MWSDLHIYTLQPGVEQENRSLICVQPTPIEACYKMRQPLVRADPASSLHPKPTQKHSSKWTDFIDPDECPDATTTQQSPVNDIELGCSSPQLPLQPMTNAPLVHQRQPPVTRQAHAPDATGMTSPAPAVAVSADPCSSPAHQLAHDQPHSAGQVRLVSGSHADWAHSAHLQPTAGDGPRHRLPDSGIPIKPKEQQAQAQRQGGPAALLDCRQGFKPPAFVAPPLIKPDQVSAPVQKPSQAASGLSTGPLRFKQNAGPLLRHVSVPSSFTSLLQYKQIWCSAVTEELSIR